MASLLLVALAAGGCGDDFPQESKLESLRILTVRAEPPEARPGEAVAIDALVFVPPDLAEAGAPRLDWRACFLASMAPEFGGRSEGAGAGGLPPSCFDLEEVLTPQELAERMTGGGELLDLGHTSLDLGSGAMVELVAPLLPSFPAPAAACAELSEAERQDRGERELWVAGLRLTVSLRLSAGGSSIFANKRLVLRPDLLALPEQAQGMPFRTPRLCREPGGNGEDGEVAWPCARNENPLAPALEAPNGEWSGEGPVIVAPGQKVKLRTLLPEPAEQQPYLGLVTCGLQVADPELQRTGGEYERIEGRYYAWYSDGGELLAAETAIGREVGDRETTWVAPETPGESYVLHVVVRDGRGGTAWATHELKVAD